MKSVAEEEADGTIEQARMEKRATKGFYCREREASPEMRESGATTSS